ncbi:MAG: hypothetical protein KDG50_09935 [Chromatiales bacterium]|nr:hypothetical protein [Chromatiales bacterium]
MIVAIALFATLMVIVGSGLALAIRSAERVDTRAARSEDLRIVQQLVRRQLAQTMIAWRTDADDGQVFAFEGRPDSIEFVAPMLTHLDLGGLYRQRLWLVDGDHGVELHMAWQPHFASDASLKFGDDDTDQPWDAVVMVESLDAGRLEYYGPKDPGDEDSVWQDEWLERAELPLAVRVQLGADGGPWPEVYVALAGRAVSSVRPGASFPRPGDRQPIPQTDSDGGTRR